MNLLDNCNDILLKIANDLLCIKRDGPFSVPNLSLSCKKYHSLLHLNGLLSKSKEAARHTWIASHTWHIHQFSTNRHHQLFSKEFNDDQNNSWRLLLFPFGNNNNNKYLSLYLQPLNNKYCLIRFSFTLHNECSSKTIIRDTSVKFDADLMDWGFREFMKNDSPQLTNIFQSYSGWLIDDVLTISVEVETLYGSGSGEIFHVNTFTKSTSH